MIDNKLIEIDNFLSTPSFFDFLKSLNADSALNLRDKPDFDNCWMKEFNSLANENIQNDDIEFIDSLREKAFKNSFRVINNSEISSRISDDLELISKSLVVGKENCWSVTYLWSSYKNGIFPK